MHNRKAPQLKINTGQSFTEEKLLQFSNKNYTQTPNISKYGNTAIKRNHNRLVELTPRNQLKTERDNQEIRYRIFVHNFFVKFGEVPDHFIEP